MKVMFINADGSGFADSIEIAEGTTALALFTASVPNAKPENYKIRVNGAPTTKDAVLQEGDRVSVTPTKIQGETHASANQATEPRSASLCR
jgi:hypothetical protein